MRRIIVLLMLTGIWMPMMQQPIRAAEGPCVGPLYTVAGVTDPDRRVTIVKRTIRCVYDRLGATYLLDEAMQVFDRESGFNPRAKNPWVDSACHPYGSNAYGSCGLGQHLARYWPGRVRSYLPSRFFPTWPKVWILGLRANVWVSARMMLAQGGVCPAWCF